MRRALSWFALVLVASAAAQVAPPSGASPVALSLGYRGQIVAGAWNPFQLTTRDVGAGTLRLRIDRGSLLEGELPWSVEVPMSGGPGLHVVDGDLFIPLWRSFVWSYEAGGRIVASGSYARALADPQPLDLVVSSDPRLAAHLMSARRIDVTSDDLPTRVAAYDGVRSIWLDGSLPNPSPAAMTAAAVAGSLVMVLGDVREATAWGGLLDPGAWRSIGAGGWWSGAAPSADELARAYLPRGEILAAFLASGGAPLPREWPRGRLLVALIGYLVAVAVAWRTGGVPGLVTSLVVFSAATVAGYSLFASEPAQLRAERELRIEGGPLAQVIRVHDVRTLPDAMVAVPRVAQPASAVAGDLHLARDARTYIALVRGRAASLHEPPTAVALVGEPHTSELAASVAITTELPPGARLVAEGANWRLRLVDGVPW